MQTSTEFKQKVKDAILAHRSNFTGSDAQYAKKLGINSSVYSQLKSGKVDKVLSESKWVSLGRYFAVTTKQTNWRIAKTKVYQEVKDSIEFCKSTSNSVIFVDECSIGKTLSAYHVSKQLQNVFYIDCSQSKTKGEFIKQLAQSIGLDGNGKYAEIKAEIKYTLNSVLEEPVIILDEAGDLNYSGLLEVKEFWNATEGVTGWFMMGAEGLKERIKRGLKSQKVGFAELFARFSSEFIKVTPSEPKDKQEFYRQLLSQVAEANAPDGMNVNKVVKDCLTKDKKLRHLKTLIQLQSAS